MGQFSSKAFDGDPYIDIMRALPEREVIWWVQQALWLAEGMTFLEHFFRTYPSVILHKCEHCNGAGTTICPACQGYKMRRADGAAAGFRLSERTATGRMLARADTKECKHCGHYCEWDVESEWEGKWQDWETKLAYYDRTYGLLFDEWYEDVLGEGMTVSGLAPLEEPMPDPKDTSMDAELTRRVKKAPRRMEALMRRYGGHPYDQNDMIPYQIADPEKSRRENYQAVEDNMEDLPPELNPTAFPELILMANSPLDEFNRQIAMEAAILQNLDAAMKDQPKINAFDPTAGTVPCPECEGQPWHYSIFPNVGKLTRSEVPFGMRTLQRMSQYWYQTDPQGNTVSDGRLYGEYPRQPLPPAELNLAMAASTSGSSGTMPAAKNNRRKKNDRFFDEMKRQKDQGPRWMAEFGTRLVAPSDNDEEQLTSTLLSSADPLSEDPLKAFSLEELDTRLYG